MRTFVMGDIHGMHKALMQCLERSAFDYDNDQLIQLGDITDGHDHVYECVEELLKIKNLIAITGNHDDWFNEFIQTDLHPLYWNLGGKGTLISYLNHSGKSGRFFSKGSGYKSALVSTDIPRSHKDFFAGQKLYHIDENNRCYVHAGFNVNEPFYDQKRETYHLNRDFWNDLIQRSNPNNERYVDLFKEVFIGHTATTKYGTNQPMNISNVWNIDTGSSQSGRLTIMDVDTKQYWQSDHLISL